MKRLLLLIPFLFMACSTKPEVVVKTKYVMVKPPLPEYKVEDFNKSLKLTFYNKGNKVCVKEWDNVCIPKERMIELVSYIKDLKTSLNKCNLKIKNYIKFREKFMKEEINNDKSSNINR